MSTDSKVIIGILIAIIILSCVLLFKILNSKNDYDPVVYSEVYEEYNMILEANGENDSKEAINIANKVGSRTVGTIEIEKINVFYPILGDATMQNMKIAPTKYYGPEINEPGNFCIAGHNYHDHTHFSDLDNLEIGDNINLTSKNGQKVIYTVYFKEKRDATDLSCTSQDTDGKKEVTLITCTNDHDVRLVVKAKQI